MNYMNNIEPKRLTDICTGAAAVVEKIEGGGAFKEKLISMGILPGKEIEVLSARKNGPVVIKISDTRLALGHGMAVKIHVRQFSGIIGACPPDIS